jgi:orotate phosphoribosyltransferase-like protein
MPIIVVPVPDSGVPAAIGYAQESGVPFELGIIRSHYVGRTFIQPSDQVRHLGVKLKHNANTALIQGKKIVLIDDSIVRGTTSASRSCRCCASPARARFTCGSPRPRPGTAASTASTRPSAPSCSPRR